jgi:hypothetical protein
VAEIFIGAASNAADLGLRALSDLAAAAEGYEYRVIGGHMVHILSHVYPTVEATQRATADADAGTSTEVAGGPDLDKGLLDRGYTRVNGNRWEAPSGDPDNPLAVDLLVPSSSGKKLETKFLGEGKYGFDAIPGLELALSSTPLYVTVHARLYRGESETFEVCVPDVEAAIVLKALAWDSRYAPKDIEDLCSLMAMVHHHREEIVWRLDKPCRGAKGDAARVLRGLFDMIDRGRRINGLHMPAAMFGAFIQRHVHM